MAQRCVIKPCVKNFEGKVVESRLFNDLLSYLPRPEAVKYYNLARNDEFLSQVNQEVRFDENGEISIEDLIREAHISIDNSQIKESLQREVGKDKRDYQDAVRQVVSFNKDNSFRRSYMAVLEEAEGKFYVKIVENNEENLDRLKSTIAGQELKNRIIYRLAEAGVDVNFVETNHSRYSTVNATRNANGLYQLIDFYKNGTTPELSEEAGHFIVGAMANSPLVQRARGLLSQEIQREILGDELNTRTLGYDTKGEVLGIMVGRALSTDIESKNALDKLISRIITGARKLFAKMKGDQIMLDKLAAEQIAVQLAEEFVRGNLDITAENAIKEQETFYHKELSKQVQALNQIKGQLASLAEDLKDIDKDAAKLVEQWIIKIENSSQNIENMQDMFAEPLAALSISQAMKLIADFVSSDTFSNLVVKVDGLTKEEFYQNLPENAAKLRMYGKFLQYCQEIVNVGFDIFNKNKDLFQSGIDHSAVIPETFNYYTNLETIHKVLTDPKTVQNFHTNERMLFAKVCEMFYGSKYVNRVTRMLWGNEKFEAVSPTQFQVEEEIAHLFADDSVVSAFLGTMSNSNNLAAQIMDKMLKQAKFEADKETGKAYAELKEWEKKWIGGEGIVSRHLFEVDESGKITGNLLDFTYSDPNSPLTISSTPIIIDWHTYEQDYEAQMRQWEEEFNEAHPEMVTKGDYYRKLALSEYVKNLKKQWHRVHSVWDVRRNCYIPNVKYKEADATYPRYINTRQSLTKAQASALSEYFLIKQKLDEASGSVMPYYRAPQMRGSFINSVSNYHFEGNSGIKSLGKTIRDKVIEFFCLMPEDISPQDAGMWSTEGEKTRKNKLIEYSKGTRSIPRFGVHRLKDMSRLSTDLVHSTTAYAAMAYNYKAMSVTANALEVGMDYIENHADEVSYKDSFGGAIYRQITHSKYKPSIGRMRDYLDRYLYGIGLPRLTIKSVCLSRLLPALSRLSSVIYLGGNMAGGLVNAFTGFIEMFKEGAASEYYDLKDLHKAYAMIMGSALGKKGMKDFITDEDSSKVNLFIRHFDIINQNDEYYRSRYTENTRIINKMIGFSIMAPYTTGEYIMQAAPYIAMALRQKVYDRHGKQVSLWEAYAPTEDGLNLRLKDHFFQTKEDAERYNRFAPLYDILMNSVYSERAWEKIKGNDEWSKFLHEKGLSPTSKLDTVRKAVSLELDRVEFSDNEEHTFNMRAREVTNRMHGVYNKMDKTMAHRTIIGSMLMTMKGYVLGLVQRRFGGITNMTDSTASQKHTGYSVALGGETEGTITTMLKMALNAKSWSDASFFFRSLILPFVPGYETAAQKRGYSVTQAKNAKRNFMDLIFISILAVINALTKPSGDDDDDELWAGHLYYLSMRLQMEQSAYNLPGALYSEASTVFDIVPSGFAVLRDIWTLGKLGYGDLMYDYKKGEEDPDIRQYFYQKEVPVKAKKGDPKWKAKLLGMIPYVRSIYWLQHPYVAAENYKYIRDINSR